MRKTIFDTQVSLFRSVSCDDSEIEKASLASLLLSDKWRDKVQAVRNEADGERRKQMKGTLPAFTPSGTFSSKAADGLVKHSGFICIDIDGKDNASVSNFAELKRLIRAVPCVEYCGLSVSGTGYFCLIPIADASKHREYFRALAHDFRRCGITIDKKCVNVNRMRFVSYDPAPYVNTAALPYDYILPATEPTARTAAKVIGRTVSDAESKDYFEAACREIEQRHIDITGDYGQWFEILCAIAHEYGEGGRGAAHLISAQAACYDRRETDLQYRECVKHGGYGYTLGTFFYYAKREIGARDFEDLLNKQ